MLFGGESLLDILHNKDFSFVKCDINDYDTLNKILIPNKFDAVIHLAAIVGDPACSLYSDLANKTNRDATKYIIDRSRDIGVRKFIFASTCSNYGKMDNPEKYVDENLNSLLYLCTQN